MNSASAPSSIRRSAALLACLLGAALVLTMPHALAQGLVQGNYYWYVPEHETFSKTQFYSQPRFDTAQVRIPRTQRFRLVAGGKGWFMLEFDVAGKAFIHMRLLRNIIYNPTADDPWYEFKRASVFAEEPAKIEARLKAAATTQTQPAKSTDTSVPSWKRYRDSWNLKGIRNPTAPLDSPDATAGGIAPRPLEKKPRSKYPLLPPIGSEPAREDGEKAGSPPGEAADTPAQQP